MIPIKSSFSTISALVCIFLPSALLSLDYPGTLPGESSSALIGDVASLENAVLSAAWSFKDGRAESFSLRNKHTNQNLSISDSVLPYIVLEGGELLYLNSLSPVSPLMVSEKQISADFVDEGSGLNLTWSASLGDGKNALIQTLKLTATRDTKVEALVFIDTLLEESRQIGSVDGSVIVCGDIFLAVEHPLAKNTVDGYGQVKCMLARGNTLPAGASWSYTSVMGVVPSGQLRRGFHYYLEGRRARPYRPFLHYNNWYDVILKRRKNRMRESECLTAIETYGRELVQKRDVQLDAFVWDDGWDDFNSLWEFHDGFPDGFKNLNEAANKYGANMGVWMSPWGGYAGAKDARIDFGKTLGYETNEAGFSMSGKKYGEAFRKVCLEMMREQGVVFFKFDGMGGGSVTSGAKGELADDIDSVLELSGALRRENSEVFISATVGTWASPFWVLHADSIWRQGMDTGFYGEGDTRQQWINFRDKQCYQRIVQLGPLYPLNSVMLHGPTIGNRPGRNPSRMVLDEKSVADEIWSFFGSGTQLQELYVSPDVPTPGIWDDLASAAKWSRAHRDILVDTHWVGGDPGNGDIYGWAAWQKGKGLLTLRNPSAKPQSYKTTLKTALEIPANAKGTVSMKTVYPEQGKLPVTKLNIQQSLCLDLQPFEVRVIEIQTPSGR